MIAVSFDTRQPPNGYMKMCRSLRSLQPSWGGEESPHADENGYRFHFTARFARLRGNGYHFQIGGSEAEGRAAETGETETAETGCPSVAVLMLPNVKRLDNT